MRSSRCDEVGRKLKPGGEHPGWTALLKQRREHWSPTYKRFLKFESSRDDERFHDTDVHERYQAKAKPKPKRRADRRGTVPREDQGKRTVRRAGHRSLKLLICVLQAQYLFKSENRDKTNEKMYKNENEKKKTKSYFSKLDVKSNKSITN